MPKKLGQKKPKPLNPFRYISSGSSIQKSNKLSAADIQVVRFLRSGAKIILNIKKSEALLAFFSGGFKEIKKISVRTLSKLISKKIITLATSMSGYLFFVESGDISWYKDEALTACNIM